MLDLHVVPIHYVVYVLQCQIHFGARQEMATESDLRVSALCSEWEAVLLHGMRRPKAKPTLRIGKTESICKGGRREGGGREG